MKVKTILGGVMSACAVLALLALATPASAQSGGVSGSVIDEAGKPVADADILISNPDNIGTTKLKTNAKGQYFSIGMRPGDYQIKATKGNLMGKIDRMHIGIGNPEEQPPIKLNAAGLATPVTAEDNAAEAKRTAAIQATLKAGQAAFDAGNFDEAITQFTKLSTDVPKCGLCYLQIGRAQLKKKDEASAEASFKKAIEVDPAKPDPYSELSSLYNGQKKFDEATAMGSKASELMAASGSADPIAIFNQGVILWNQSKAAEAGVQFQKATELDPKMADAHYFLGMSLVNQNKLPEAKKSFETYLSLAPTGQYADQVKSLMTALK